MKISDEKLQEIAAILAAGIVSSNSNDANAKSAVQAFDRVLMELEKRYKSEPV